jgi:hypothetical protein
MDSAAQLKLLLLLVSHGYPQENGAERASGSTFPFGHISRGHFLFDHGALLHQTRSRDTATLKTETDIAVVAMTRLATDAAQTATDTWTAEDFRSGTRRGSSPP